MKHTILFLALIFTACLTQAQTQFKSDTAAIAFAQKLEPAAAFTIDSVNCRNCLDVRTENLRVQFWKKGSSYTLASITGNETAVKSIWQNTFGGTQTGNIIKAGKEVLSISHIDKKYRIEYRVY